jgi:hypothetical protein
MSHGSHSPSPSPSPCPSPTHDVNLMHSTIDEAPRSRPLSPARPQPHRPPRPAAPASSATVTQHPVIFDEPKTRPAASNGFASIFVDLTQQNGASVLAPVTAAVESSPVHISIVNSTSSPISIPERKKSPTDDEFDAFSSRFESVGRDDRFQPAEAPKAAQVRTSSNTCKSSFSLIFHLVSMLPVWGTVQLLRPAQLQRIRSQRRIRFVPGYDGTASATSRITPFEATAS